MTFNPFISFGSLTDEELEAKMQEIGNKIAKMRPFPNMTLAREQLEEIYNQAVDEKYERYAKRNSSSEPEVMEIGTIKEEPTDDQ